MRHRKSKSTLDRKAAARTSLVKNLTEGLILNAKIKTTEAKAKAVRPLAENLIYWGKRDNLHSKRMLRRYLSERTMKRLITDIIPQLSSKTSGYTRITPLGFRRGDGAEMAVLEYLVQPKTEKKEGGKKEEKADKK